MSDHDTASALAHIERLSKLLDGPRDGGLLRYSLGLEWLKAGEPARAAEFLREAVARQADYSAAWKQLGHALQQSGDAAGAIAAWQEGMRVAEARGDVQAGKEMGVFVRRLEKLQAEALAEKN
jgi:Tfp pilus assembly protein PilF